MKKIFLITAVTFGSFLCCDAQTNAAIKNIKAFFTTTISGRPIKDDNGRIISPVPQINRVLYIETKGKIKPVPETVLYNNVVFDASVSDSSHVAVRVGITTAGRPLLLKPGKGNYIWKMDVIIKDKNEKVPENIRSIIVKGRVGKNKFTYSLKEETELRGPDTY